MPHTESSDRMKLTEEGGKPQTVIHVSSGDAVLASPAPLPSSWLLLNVWWNGDCRELVLKLKMNSLEKFNEIPYKSLILRTYLWPGVAMDRLGVKRRELVGGPPAFSRELRFSELFRFSW